MKALAPFIHWPRGVMPEVRDNPEQNRFELDTSEGPAIAVYRMRDGNLHITHTEVPKVLEGRGIGSQLVRGTLEIARTRGVKVVPRCPFVAAYMRRHPEFNDLLA
jgi:uncharacterized protein